MQATRAVAVLGMASVLSAAVPEPAPAAGPNSTVLLSRPSGLGADAAVDASAAGMPSKSGTTFG